MAWPVAAIERLETRTLLSASSIYPDLVATVGVYDENTVQSNTVDVTATGSSMTHAEFAARMADAWLNNTGTVLEGSGLGSVFGFGQDQNKVLHIGPDADTGWAHESDLSSPTPISGSGAFSSTYSPAQYGHNALTLYFGLEFADEHEQIVEFGLTVLNQNPEQYGTVYVWGHTAWGGFGAVEATHEVVEGAQDVFYGLRAPAGDYFVGLTVAYSPDPALGDNPLYIDDIGFISGLPNGEDNQQPTAGDDAFSVEQDTLLLVDAPGLLANDSDPDGHQLTAYLAQGPSHGYLQLNSDGSFYYQAHAGYTGVDSFTYGAWDGAVSSKLATVTLTVVGEPNLPPLVESDNYVANEDQPLVVSNPESGLLANDSDPDGDPLTAVLVSGPSHGTLALNPDGTFSYTPDANYHGADSFTYRAHDGAAESDVATVTLGISPVNDIPIAPGEGYSLNEDGSLVVASVASGVLANDFDVDGDPLTAVLVSGPINGTLVLNPDGTFSYTPNADYHGVDSFRYRASDGAASSTTTTVTLSIAAVNDQPVAEPDGYTLTEDGSLVVTAGAVGHLTMVSEPGDYIGQGQTYDLDGLDGTFTATRNFDNGVQVSYRSHTDFGDYWVLQFAAPGAVELTAGVYTGATRFPFQADDAPGLSVYGQGRGSNTLTGEFTVHEVLYDSSGAVLIFDASFEQHNEGLDPALTGRIQYASPQYEDLLANDHDIEGAALTAVLVSGPSHGTLMIGSDGGFVYTPAADFHGTDAFTYQVSDGTLSSDPAAVTITVAPVNDAPVVSSASVSTPEDTSLSGTVTASDIDEDSLTFSLASGAAHGTLVFNPDGSYTYTPAADFHGSDSFSFTANDGSASSTPAVVTIAVNPVNDAPVGSSAAGATDEDTPLSGELAASDVDGDPLSFALAAEPSHGSVVVNSDGSYTYTPPTDFHGSDSFSFTVNDGSGFSDPAVVTITVNSVNDVPVARGLVAVMNEDASLHGALTASDVDGDSLTFQLAAGPANGTLVLNADGTYSYSPSANFHGTDSFSFTANDGSESSDPAVVMITVNSINDVPVANGQAVVTEEDTSLNGTLTAADVDGDSLTFQLVAGPSSGTLVLNSDGTYSYTPSANFHGTDSFSFSADDGTVPSEPAVVTITVQPVNDTPLLEGAAFLLEENSDQGTVVGSVSGSDLDGDPLQYSLISGNGSGAFAIDAATGVITVADSTQLDFEMTPEFVLTVQAVDAAGAAVQAAVVVQLTDIVEIIPVAIDIRPGDGSNTISSKGNDLVEVAILSTASFDAQTVDVESLRFGRTGTEDSLRRTWQGQPQYRFEDVNGDGLLDLIVEFDRDLLGFHNGDTRGYLTGQTLSGDSLAGDDQVTLSGKGWPN